jgi:mono/diheme cytochrome c family protein
MKKTAIALLSLFLLFSCNTDTIHIIKGPLNEQNLLVQFFTINIDADTTLLTKNGCVIKIPKGAIASSNKNVKLEIKEALNNTDIVLAGLSTMSGKQALSSGGMIYFNAASGYNIEIKKQIEILVPTKNYNRDMQVFKGDTANGKIDWQQPEALPADSTTAKVDAGKGLFLSNCASCHKVYEDFTGPALYGITDRLPWEWVYGLTVHNISIPKYSVCIEGEGSVLYSYKDSIQFKYAQEHGAILSEGERACLYHRCLRSKYGSEMTSFPQLTEKDVANIYAYVKSESTKRPELKEKFAHNCCDSCVDYVENKISLMTQRENLKEDNNNFFTLDREIPVPPAAIEDYEPDTTAPEPYKKVSPAIVSATYYTINIKAVGWYNIDILMKNYSNCIESELFVRLQGSYAMDININLIIPQYKVFVEGGKLSDGQQYGFDELDGKIMLPQNTQAYIIAFAEKNDNLIFAKKEFNTQTKQTIELSFTEISKQQLKAEIRALKLDNVTADVKDSKNADAIRAIDKNIKNADSLKPKNCNCDFLAFPAQDSVAKK